MKLFLLKEKKKLLVSLICVFLSLVFISFTSALIFSIPFLLPTLGSFLPGTIRREEMTLKLAEGKEY